MIFQNSTEINKKEKDKNMNTVAKTTVNCSIPTVTVAKTAFKTARGR
jgi:hypothetical protein